MSYDTSTFIVNEDDMDEDPEDLDEDEEEELLTEGDPDEEEV